MVISLHEMCLKVLIENVEGNHKRILCKFLVYMMAKTYLFFCAALFDTGGVPFHVLEPVLAK